MDANDRIIELQKEIDELKGLVSFYRDLANLYKDSHLKLEELFTDLLDLKL